MGGPPSHAAELARAVSAVTTGITGRSDFCVHEETVLLKARLAIVKTCRTAGDRDDQRQDLDIIPCVRGLRHRWALLSSTRADALHMPRLRFTQESRSSLQAQGEVEPAAANSRTL